MAWMHKALEVLGWNDRTGFDYLTEPGAVYSSMLAPDPSTLAPIIPPTGAGGTVDESLALAVPPVARAVALYSTMISGTRIVTDDGRPAPAWMNHTGDDPTPSGHRWARIANDLNMHGLSIALKVPDDNGRAANLLHIPRRFWRFSPEGDVEFIGGGAYLDAVRDLLVYFPALMPTGFLSYGAASIRHYHSIMRTIDSRADNPIPMVELKVTDMFAGTPAELKQAQADWATARQSKNGAVAMTPEGINVIVHQPANSDGEMLLAARNAVRLDVANYQNMNAALLDGNNGTSDTYSNTLQNRTEFTDLSVAWLAGPIAARLSQDDITPPGMVVHFDLPSMDAPHDAAGNIGTATTRTPLEEHTA